LCKLAGHPELIDFRKQSQSTVAGDKRPIRNGTFFPCCLSACSPLKNPFRQSDFMKFGERERPTEVRSIVCQTLFIVKNGRSTNWKVFFTRPAKAWAESSHPSGYCVGPRTQRAAEVERALAVHRQSCSVELEPSIPNHSNAGNCPSLGFLSADLAGALEPPVCPTGHCEGHLPLKKGIAPLRPPSRD